ncbi:MAG TPA: hypothetical protein VFG89_02870 [Coriobacteriia bacterium]|nr:hypothetical protein [Coriobacteriia bacterium]
MSKSVLESVPASTRAWLAEPDNPAVAVMAARLFGDSEPKGLWAKRNGYEPVAGILADMREDGSWDTPQRDYQKYGGSLWQIAFLGELWADGSDPRIKKAAEYAFSRQTPSGKWTANPKAAYDMPCLTSNVGRAMARLGWSRDERVIQALAYDVDTYRRLGYLGCSDMSVFTLNGYCHMLVPKHLLFMGEIPRELWPEGAEELRDACIDAMRDKQVHCYLPAEAKEFQPLIYEAKAAERDEVREGYLAEHPELHFGPKPGWLRFGYPLSYNSDALESLRGLMAVDEPMRPEYEEAVRVVRDAADDQMRWTLKNSFNGKMRANVEKKGQPSKWLTLYALQVLDYFG